MAVTPALTDHIAPNSVQQLERAAGNRFEEGECLKKQNRLLAALYLYGYSVEMCLAAAYFRSNGFSPNRIITENERRRRMAQARQILHQDGDPLMSNLSHPLDGWARFLAWHRQLKHLSDQEKNRLREAVRKARMVCRHWRPELRYKTTCVLPRQFDEVRHCTRWFIEQRGRF